MNCNECVRLLHLNRTGERTAQETGSMMSHLETCRSCAEEYQSIASMDALYSSLRTTAPKFSGEEEFDAAILSSVYAMDQSTTVKRKFSMQEFLLNVHRRRSVRLAYGLYVIIIFGVFFFEYTSIIRDRQQLEANIAQIPPTERLEASYAIHADDVSELIGKTALNALCNYAGTDVSHNRIILSSDRISSLNDLYQNRDTDISSKQFLPEMTSERLKRVAEHIFKSTTKTFHLEANGV